VGLDLLRHADDSHGLPGRAAAEVPPPRRIGQRRPAARDGIAVRAGRRIAEENDEALGDLLGHHSSEAVCLDVHRPPRQPEHVHEQALGQPMAADGRHRPLPPFLGEEDPPPRPLDETLAYQPPEHLGDRRRRPAEQFCEACLDDRRALLAQPADRLQILLHRWVEVLTHRPPPPARQAAPARLPFFG